MGNLGPSSIDLSDFGSVSFGNSFASQKSHSRLEGKLTEY